MIRSVAIEAFQSLSDLKLHLDRWTVIYGPSNSGKSALVRALKLWRHNTASSSYVQVGKAFASVDVDGLVIRRGRGVSEYRIGDDRYSKAGTSVPVEVEARMADVQIVEQFDSPFLLSDSPSAAARVLGSLTGVGRLFAASREAQRRLAERKKVLALREADLREVEEAAQPLQSVPERLERMAEVKERLTAVYDALLAYERVQALRQVQISAREKLERSEQRLSLRVPPEFAALLDRWREVLSRSDQASLLAVKAQTLDSEGGHARRQVEALSAELDAVVQQNEVCDHCPLLIST